MIEYIDKTAALIEKRAEINEQIADLTRPALIDRELIPVIYELFEEILSNRDFPPNIIIGKSKCTLFQIEMYKKTI